MPGAKKADIVRAYFAAYKTRDRKTAEDLLAGDFTFTSPYDDAIGKSAYFEKCWRNSERMRALDLEKVFERGDEAFVRYKCIAKDGLEFRNTEFFTFAGDKIRQVQVYFGATYRHGALVTAA